MSDIRSTVQGGPKGPIMLLDAGNSRSYPGSGNIWYDLTSYSNNATLVNSPVYNNTHFSFNGTNQYCSVTNNEKLNSLDAFANSYSIQMWVRSSDPVPTNTFGARLIEKRSAGGNYPFSWQTNFSLNERLGLFVFASPQIPFVDVGNLTNLWDSVWHQVVMVVDFNSDKIIGYRDGVNVSEATNTTTVSSANSGDVRIATNSDNTTPYTGDIGQVAIYDRVLSASEVLQNYNVTKGRFGL